VPEELGIVQIYPELLGTYGDRGNALALLHRAAARGVPARLVPVAIGKPLPREGDIFLLGGGEDSAQLLAARLLLADSRAHTVLGSRPCLAVCAGLQLLSHHFDDADGCSQPGLGVLDVTCGRLARRAVGEIVTEPADLPDVPTLTGFENHRGTAELGPGARPLGRVITGTGNGDHGWEGVVQGVTLATYLHGPVLVRNPALADHLLTSAAGTLPAYDDAEVERLRTERLDAADPRRHFRRGRHLVGRRG
jgi:CobQ-like glutamine amidotransferase family enzyme